MGAKDIMKNILGIVLLIAAIGSAVMALFVYSSRQSAPNTNELYTLIAAGLMAIYSLMNIVSAFIAIGRRNRRKAARVRPVIQIAVVLAIIQIVISAMNGIYVSHLLILLGTSIAIPEIVLLLLGIIAA